MKRLAQDRDRSDSMPTRRILVVTYHFPPDGAVGGLRWSGLSKHLARRGWSVHVLTAAEQTEAAPPGVVVHTRLRRRTLNDRYNAVAARLRRDLPKERESAPIESAPTPGLRPRRGALRTWLRAVRSDIAYALACPDEGRGWILRAARQGRRLLREQPFDAIVSSGPPHSAHLAALLAAWGRRVPRYVDMRDPWAGMMDKAWARELRGSSAWARILPRWLERLVFRSVACVITNTEEFAAFLAAADPRLPVAVVSNGVDCERLPPRQQPARSGLSIAYLGTLYGGRDLEPLLHAVREFLDRHPEIPSAAIRLDLAGSLVEPHRTRFLAQLRQTGLEASVAHHGLMPRAEALALLARCSLAVVLAQDQQLQVPAKLYEPVAMHVPTLVIAEPASAAAREAERVGAHAVAPVDVARIVGLLEGLWNGSIPPRAPPRAAIDYAQLAESMAALVSGGAVP